MNRRERAARAAAQSYRETLREMKRRGLKVDDMPDDVAQSALVLHQNALLVAMLDRQRKKEKDHEFKTYNSTRV